jgi:hypothetical protein
MRLVRGAVVVALWSILACGQEKTKTELTQDQKVEMWKILGENNKIIREIQSLQKKQTDLGTKWNTRAAELQKEHKADGCLLNGDDMTWTDCKPVADDSKGKK